MITSTILGLLIPFIGTSLGAACVLFMKNELSVKTTKMLSGFAAGVMIAASVWSLLIPALEQSEPWKNAVRPGSNRLYARNVFLIDTGYNHTTYASR